jgi:hypothetical protein
MTTDMSAFPKKASPPLLRLAPPIRRRIYRYVGLASWDGAPYRFDLRGQLASRQAPDTSSFHGLLVCCRDIYAEAAILLYSSNRFILHYSHTDPGSLEPLRALSPSSLASLTSLRIILNQASCNHPSTHDAFNVCCVVGHEEEEFSDVWRCKNRHSGLHDPPLLSPASEPRNSNASEDAGDDSLSVARTLLSEWHSAAAGLPHTKPGRLELSLVCDIDPRHGQALNIAKSAVAPIHLLPPSHLKACHIRLGKAADSQLQQVARGTVMYACGISTQTLKPSLLSTLMSLPRELRLRILEYTDLITPNREVTWSRHDGGYYVSAIGWDPSSSPSFQHMSQFFGCWHGKIGCFCRRRHAAFSLQCKCWAPPEPLFLVCRTLYQDSQLVFFSGNRIIVRDFRSDAP